MLEYNKLFANENDKLKNEYTTLVSYVEECKRVIKEEKERNGELETKIKKYEEKVKHYDVPEKGLDFIFENYFTIFFMIYVYL